MPKQALAVLEKRFHYELQKGYVPICRYHGTRYYSVFSTLKICSDYCWTLCEFWRLSTETGGVEYTEQPYRVESKQLHLEQPTNQHFCCCSIPSSEAGAVALGGGDMSCWMKWANRFLISVGCEAKENSQQSAHLVLL